MNINPEKQEEFWIAAGILLGTLLTTIVGLALSTAIAGTIPSAIGGIVAVLLGWCLFICVVTGSAMYQAVTKEEEKPSVPEEITT